MLMFRVDNSRHLGKNRKLARNYGFIDETVQ